MINLSEGLFDFLKGMKKEKHPLQKHKGKIASHYQVDRDERFVELGTLTPAHPFAFVLDSIDIDDREFMEYIQSRPLMGITLISEYDEGIQDAKSTVRVNHPHILWESKISESSIDSKLKRQNILIPYPKRRHPGE